MATPFLGEIRIFSFPFAPKGWALANGQILQIAQNQALFSLLGVTYGGNGQTTFALPNLQGRVSLGFNGQHPQGQAAGEAAHALTVAEIPAHNHVPSANNARGTVPGPAGNYWAGDSNGNQTFGSAPNVALSPSAISAAGASQPHPNLMPYLTVNFCIAVVGIFPSRT